MIQQTPPAPCPQNKPFTPCWCEQNPSHIKCLGAVPLNNNVGILIIIFIFVIFFRKKI